MLFSRQLLTNSHIPKQQHYPMYADLGWQTVVPVYGPFCLVQTRRRQVVHWDWHTAVTEVDNDQ